MKEKLEQWIQELNDWKNEKSERRAFILLATDVDEKCGTYAAAGDPNAMSAGILSTCMTPEKVDGLFLFLAASRGLDFILANMDDFKEYIEKHHTDDKE